MPNPIVVVGSLNMDFVVQMKQLPARGETLNGWGFQMLPGGKGANQACAAGRLGGITKMVGRVGRDVFADQQRASLAAAGVDTEHVLTTDGEATGVALIFVESGGQNMIVIAAGANGKLAPEDLRTASRAFESGYLLLQLETPVETVEAAAVLGRSQGMITILDPAPARPLPESLLSQVDLLTPNETEALVLLGQPPREIKVREADDLACGLLERGPRQVIIKLGAKGVWWRDHESGRHFPAPQVEAVDSTAAGDTFNGALAVALAEGLKMDAAIIFANCAAALSVTKLGAQASIPTRQELDLFRAGHCGGTLQP
jgi:ribokinase